MKNWLYYLGCFAAVGVMPASRVHAQPLAPIVATLPASAVGVTNATLNGIGNPKSFLTFGYFQWGTTTNYGNVTSPQSLGNGGSDTNFSQVVGGLLVGVTYHFRAVASNSFYVVSGTNQSFRTTMFSFVTNLPVPLSAPYASWGDYDNDGRLDILLENMAAPDSLWIWRNTGNGFSNISLVVPPVNNGIAAWGDYNNDGLLDIAYPPYVLQNIGTGFFANDFHLHGNNISPDDGAFSLWGDLNNDGRLDLVLDGWRTWSNNGTSFVAVQLGLAPASGYKAARGDYDNDGWLDLLLFSPSVGGVKFWRNAGGSFSNLDVGFPFLSKCSAAWGDHDNDGRLDLVLTGLLGTNGYAQIWRNTAGGFTNLNADLPGIVAGSVAWGDYDNDGRLDLLLSGTTNFDFSGRVCQIWRNAGSGFTNINADLPGILAGSVAWGDYDNDGRLDILLAGVTNSSSGFCQVWRNNTANTNTPPTAPGGLFASIVANNVALHWNPATDAQTPASGLTYNLRVGTTPGGGEIVSPEAAGSGFRRVPEFGNAQMSLSRPLKDLSLGHTIYWSVQAVDSAFSGSPFAAEKSFTLGQVFTPANGVPIPGDQNGDGIVSQTELNTVLSNYFPYSPFLQMTNVAGLGGTNVTFSLSNSTAGAFSAEYSTNLSSWFLLGPATPRYLFTDTNAPAVPQRYYRLRWP